MFGRTPPGRDATLDDKTTEPSDAKTLAALALLVAAAVAFAHWPALNASAITFDDGEYLTDKRSRSASELDLRQPILDRSPPNRPPSTATTSRWP